MNSAEIQNGRRAERHPDGHEHQFVTLRVYTHEIDNCALDAAEVFESALDEDEDDDTSNQHHD
ncbi:hypothetical protein [Streptomyces sp. WMMB 322]|uniref:hypothetical protein n=1 Tax=Streptomyces sp. WMMB 322 TaxID=1286821 RepID=UPI0006E24E8C|nr:hypothetical protein [Streptomyces sp. WMMB 322]SCK13281.1 hypothetical protein H180DRAFT_00806 [Streptomyces sp. WMMB 322]